jgi:hypothetical protein
MTNDCLLFFFIAISKDQYSPAGNAAYSDAVAGELGSFLAERV